MVGQNVAATVIRTRQKNVVIPGLLQWYGRLSIKNNATKAGMAHLLHCRPFE